jgi:hypothetical protein
LEEDVEPFGNLIYTTQNMVLVPKHKSMEDFSKPSIVTGDNSNNFGICGPMVASFLYTSFREPAVLRDRSYLPSTDALAMNQAAANSRFLRGSTSPDEMVEETMLEPAGISTVSSESYDADLAGWKDLLEEALYEPGRYFCLLQHDDFTHAIGLVTAAGNSKQFLLDPNSGLYETSDSSRFVTANAERLCQIYAAYDRLGLYECELGGQRR